MGGIEPDSYKAFSPPREQSGAMTETNSSRSAFGPRQAEVLSGWVETVQSSPTGIGYDFTTRSADDRLAEALDAFLDDPTREHFTEVCNSLERASVMEGYIIGQWPDSLEELAAFLQEIRAAETWDDDWTEHFGSPTWLFELFTRTHATYPVVDTQTQTYLRRFGIRVDDDFESQVAGMQTFRDRYEQAVGQVTAATEYEVSLDREIDELFQLLYQFSKDDIPPRLLGVEKPVYEPLIGFEGTRYDGGRIEFDIDLVERVLAAYSEGVAADTYVDSTSLTDAQRDEFWCGSYPEGWKHEAATQVSESLFSELDATALDTDGLEDVLAAFDKGYGIIDGSIIEYLLSPQQGWRIWGDFKERTREKPEVAAAVLSRFFDPDASYVTGRLELFRWYYGDEENLRAGALMKLATGLLMLAQPNRYVMYQHSRCKAFMEDVCISGFEVDRGYNPTQYHRINAAAKELKDQLDSRLDRDATMVDVQSIFYFWKENPLN